jgi:N,N'-diacetyllegionaminate synthase
MGTRIFPSEQFVERLSTGHPVVIIAEAGVNHNGNPALAHRLIDLAADAGADAVKFQTFDPKLVVSDHAPLAPYQEKSAADGVSTQAEMVASLALNVEVWPDLVRHAHDRNVEFLSTPFDSPSADLLEGLGVPCFKVPSGEITNLPFLHDLARRGLPLIVSTGMATLEEVATACGAVALAPLIILMHCVSEYPAEVSDANLRAIATMRDAFHTPVGWSDHTLGAVTAIAAVALGATVLEKHVTLDCSMPGPDHRASADLDTFLNYVRSVREAQASLGDGMKRPVPAEAVVRDVARRSWHTTADLVEGRVLTTADLVALRPGTGIPPGEDLVGRRLLHSVERGALIKRADLEPEG